MDTDTQKPMREGHTTGATATAAMKAALLALAGEFPKEVTVLSPQNQPITVPIESARAEEGTGTATALKDGGDDLDVTHGTPIVVSVRYRETAGLELKAGKGVGTVTKPGLQVAVGKPAINPGPQIMMRKVYDEMVTDGRGLVVTISVPEGEELAKQTLNPAMGVIGGISIIGTTGIVKPMSEEAYKRSLVPQLSVIKASGAKTVVLVPGRIGEHAAENLGIPRDAMAETSNFIGFMMETAVSMGFSRILLIGHMGKLLKVASGSFHTYNRVSDGRMETMAAWAAACGANPSVVKELLACTTTDAGTDIIRREHLEVMYPLMAARAEERCRRYIFDKAEVGVIFVTMEGNVVAASPAARKLSEEEAWHIG